MRPISDFEMSYGFQDIAIKQKENLCKSRLDVNIESEIVRGVVRPTPFIAANMRSCVNASFIIKLYKLGAFGILHRADDPENILIDVKAIAKENEWVAASVGVGDEQKSFARELIRMGANIITVDIAHGYCDPVFEMCRHIKGYSPQTKVILGNATNLDFIREANANGADAIKVGIAGGYSCQTANMTGCREKQFSVAYRFKEISRELGLPVISDGSIREPADAVLAIGAGCNSIMAGKIFAACPESAAETIFSSREDPGKKMLVGMASRATQNVWRGGVKANTCTEGTIAYLDIGEPAEKLIERYSGALRSGITYGGGRDIKSFQDNVEFVRFK